MMTKITLDEVKVKLRGVKLIPGGQALRATDHEICIMEAVTYVMHGGQGLETYGFHPPCVSEAITNFLIQVNDNWTSSTKRARLKGLIPSIVGTCPTRKVVGKVVPSRSKAHEAREAKRQKIKREALRTKLGPNYTRFDFHRLSFNDVKEIVEAMVAVK